MIHTQAAHELGSDPGYNEWRVGLHNHMDDMEQQTLQGWEGVDRHRVA